MVDAEEDRHTRDRRGRETRVTRRARRDAADDDDTERQDRDADRRLDACERRARRAPEQALDERPGVERDHAAAGVRLAGRAERRVVLTHRGEKRRHTALGVDDDREHHGGHRRGDQHPVHERAPLARPCQHQESEWHAERRLHRGEREPDAAERRRRPRPPERQVGTETDVRGALAGEEIRVTGAAEQHRGRKRQRRGGAADTAQPEAHEREEDRAADVERVMCDAAGALGEERERQMKGEDEWGIEREFRTDGILRPIRRRAVRIVAVDERPHRVIDGVAEIAQAVACELGVPGNHGVVERTHRHQRQRDRERHAGERDARRRFAGGPDEGACHRESIGLRRTAHARASRGGADARIVAQTHTMSAPVTATLLADVMRRQSPCSLFSPTAWISVSVAP